MGLESRGQAQEGIWQEQTGDSVSDSEIIGAGMEGSEWGTSLWRLSPARLWLPECVLWTAEPSVTGV